MKRLTIVVLCAAIFLGGTAVTAAAQIAPTPTKNDGSFQDFHIDKDGNIQVYQAKVMQVSGTTFYVRYYVGLAYIRLLVKTTPDTKVYRRYGDEISMARVSAGDILNIEGKIENGADSLSLIANKLTDFSDQTEITGFKGTIASVNPSEQIIILSAVNQGSITIALGTSTQIKKGSRIITADLVHPGDRVIDTVGAFDHATKTLAANVIVIYVDMKTFAPRNFQGTLKAIGNDSPQTLTVSAEGKDYSVALSPDAVILNNRRKTVSLRRFVAGDTIRIYGSIREAENPIIDAQIIRNLSL